MTLATDLPAARPRNTDTIPDSALLIGFAGAVPFLVGATLPAFGFAFVGGVPVRVALIVYGAVILSFLGGIRWGLALRDGDRRRQAIAFFLSALPAAIGWTAVLIGTLPGLALLACAFAIQGMIDIHLTGTGQMPGWFGRLRIVLTILVVGSLSLAFSVGMRPLETGPAASRSAPVLPKGHPLLPDNQGPVRPKPPGVAA
jgi:hypothetical protein